MRNRMADPLCAFMGIADVIAGILIIFAFGFNTFAIVFGLIMIIKGGISFA